MMDGLAYKVRVSLLWILAMIAFVAYRSLAVNAGADEVSLLGDQDFASYLLVMAVFAFLSLVLGNGVNRLTNVIAGGILAVAQVIMLIDGLVGYPTESFNLMTGVSVVALASVVWFALRWPIFSADTRRASRTDRESSEPLVTSYAETH
jgi:hypothetical protein